MGCSQSRTAPTKHGRPGGRVKGNALDYRRVTTEDTELLNCEATLRIRDDSSDECPGPMRRTSSWHSLAPLSEFGDDSEEDEVAEGDSRPEGPFGRPIEQVYQGVHDGPVLGSGRSGAVRLATHRATGGRYAVKCLDLSLVGTEEEMDQLYQEIYVMTQLDHPNVVLLEEVYESDSEIYLVQELCSGGDIFEHLEEQPEYRYSEDQCARLVKSMLCAVRYIHSKGIVHRDLKLENYVFSDTGDDPKIKLIDFGLSKYLKFGEVQREAVGTPYTVAPEVLRGRYDEKCDIWAIGVIAHLLLCGDPPFGGCDGESLGEVRDNIMRGDVALEGEVWDGVSSLAKGFVRRMLVADPDMRPTAREAQEDPWIMEVVLAPERTKE